MKQALLVILMICSMLVGCSGNKVTISEVNIEEVNDHLINFINNIEQDKKDTGIYVYNDSKNQIYLYLNQDFLNEGRDFGDVDLRTVNKTFNIYLNDISTSEKQTDTYKLYKINLPNDREIIKVYKNNIETHFAGVGL